MSVTKEDIRKKVEKNIASYENRIAMWKKVELVKKKDGTPYQSFGKNFTNCRIGKDWNDVKIEVYGWNDKGEWDTDYVSTRIVFAYYHDECGKISEDRIIKEPCLMPYFYLTADEAYIFIQNHIKKLEGWLERERECLERLDTAYDYVTEELKAVEAKLNELCGGDRNTLYYECRKRINEFPY